VLPQYRVSIRAHGGRIARHRWQRLIGFGMMPRT
jgi:hypothetical protein